MFLNKSEYAHVIQLIDRKISPSPLLADFQEWVQKKYNTKLYDYICDTTSDGLARLRVILWDAEDTAFLHESRLIYSKKKQKEIRDEFAGLSLNYQCNSEYQHPERVFVCAETIADEIREHIFTEVSSQIESIQGKDIWKITIALNTVHIFYLTEENREQHKGDDQENKTIQQVNDIVLPLDRYGAFSRGICFAFSSKEILDTQFEGNMYYYLV